MSACQNEVIPSRVDGEGPRTWSPRQIEVRTRSIAVERSLAVCAARDDSREHLVQRTER